MSHPEREPEGTDSDSVGVIDTVGQAFGLLNKRPYLIWLPILLDVVIWTGWRVSIVEPLSGADLRITGAARTAFDVFSDWLAGLELVSLLSSLLPTLLDGTGTEPVPELPGGTHHELTGEPALIMVALTGLAAFVIGMMYLTMIGRIVINQPAWGFGYIRDVLATSVRAAGLGMTMIGLVAFLMLPFALIAVVLYLLGIMPWVLLFLVTLVFISWFGLVSFFGIQAIALGEHRVMWAVRSSYQLLTNNLLAVAGLLLIALVIRTGTPVALQVFTDTQWSVPFAIVVNAYIATGLLTAMMLFYHNRSPQFAVGSAVDQPDARTEQKGPA